MNGNDNDSEKAIGDGVGDKAGGEGRPGTDRTGAPQAAVATSSPGAASLMGMFAPPPPPPPPNARSSGRGISAGSESSARSGGSSASRSSPAAAQLMGMFAAPPGSKSRSTAAVAAAAPALRKTPRERSDGAKSDGSGNGGRALEIPPLPRRPASDVRWRQTTEMRSDRSIRRQSSVTDSSTDGDEQGVNNAFDVSDSLAQTPPTRNFSAYLRNYQAGLSQRALVNEHDERSALLMAHASTSPGRVVGPAAGLRTVHDLFRPPSETGSGSIGDGSAGDLGSGGDVQRGGYASMASAAAPEIRNRAKGMQDVVKHPNQCSISVVGRPSLSKESPSAQKPVPPSRFASVLAYLRCNLTREAVSSTIIGSAVFAMYHVVFCLAFASSVTRPSHSSSDGPNRMVAPMVQMVALGSLAANPTYIYLLGHDLPALYPCVDLFLAPFAAHLAAAVDAILVSHGVTDDGGDEIFLATFAALNCIALLLSAALCYLASKFKLANLGAFLPYSVICGFFSAVAILLWTLAFTVDTGLHAGDALLSGDWPLVRECLVHHVPSLVVALLMKVLGPKKPWLTPLLVVCTVALGYAVMFLTGTSLSRAQDLGWFWTKEEFVYEGNATGLGSWIPPAPFGILPAVLRGKVHLPALVAGLPGAVAMAAVYLIRCSIHAAALKKNGANLLKLRADMMRPPVLPAASKVGSSAPPHLRCLQLDADESETEKALPCAGDEDEGRGAGQAITVSMIKIISCYGAGLALAAVIGGHGALPAIAAGPSMVKLGSSGVAPQYGSNILLLLFYVSNFAVVSYIPKPAFSCLILLAFLDLSDAWLVRSFFKMKNKVEWLVVPVIVVLTFIVGMLQSVALGIALSTFIFVGNLYRTGTVKFIASGLTIRSTIERSGRDADWLDQNGDLLQILVLQNYLFFGNASSCLEYVRSMFEEEPAPGEIDFELPPMPKYLVLDLTLVTGLDTSAVDVLADIIALSNSYHCHVTMAGCSPNLRSILACGGLKPSAGRRGLKFHSDLESALGKAEDNLLKHVLRVEDRELQHLGTRERTRSTDGDDGFRHALRLIDEQHDLQFAPRLEGIQRYIQPIELQAGETLFGDNGAGGDRERGLFFIESGLMKVERDPSYTMTRGSNASLRRKVGPGFANQRLFNEGSIGHLRARTATIGRKGALLKATAGHRTRTSHNLRLARIGPGWVVGAIEGLTGLKNPGTHSAVTSCRLHLLTYHKLEELEKNDPACALSLFKLMSHLMSRRQELTIEHLSTLHSIMTSPAPTKPVSRVTMGALSAIQSAFDSQ